MSDKKMKKAMILYYPIIAGFVVGLAVFYVSSLTSEPDGQPQYTGEMALNYVKAAKIAEHKLLMIEDLAKQASYLSIYDTALNGGFYLDSECGTTNGFNLWMAEQECHPDVKESMSAFLKQHLNNYLTQYEETKGFNENYDYLIKEGDKLRIIGIATLPITIPITANLNIKNKLILTEIGNYSIKPSFEHIIDYNLNDYETIKQIASELSSTCEKETDVKKCVEQKITAINALHQGKPKEYPLKWSIGSREPTEKLFYDFVEKYESCLNSKDIDCTCNFKLDYEDIDFKGKYTISVSHDHSDTKFQLTQPKGYDLAYTIKDNLPAIINNDHLGLLQQLANFKYSVTYTDKGDYKSTQLIYPEIYNFDFTKETRLYKKSKDKVVFVRKDSKEYQNLDECSTPNIFRFTVENLDKEFLIYDQETKTTDFRPVEIRFAINIKDLPPPPIEELRVKDEQKREGTVSLRWKKSPAADVARYTIYYSDKDFSRQEIIDNKIQDPHSSIGFAGTIDTKQVSARVDDKYTFDKISKNQAFSPQIQNWAHIAMKEANREWIRLELKKAYYQKETEEYVYILDGLEDNQKYYFAVTAIDKAGNEINNKDQEQKLKLDKNYISATPEDNLAPNKITNIDLTQVHLISRQHTFEFDLPSENEDGTLIQESQLWLYVYSTLSDDCNFQSIRDGLDPRTSGIFNTAFKRSTINVPASPLTSGEYCFTFILRDESNNPSLDDVNINDLVEIEPIQIY